MQNEEPAMKDPTVLFDELEAVLEKHSGQFAVADVLTAIAANTVTVIMFDDDDTERQTRHLKMFIELINDAVAFARRYAETEKQAVN